jgi:alkylhydroperoxidase family enzyme
MRGRTGHGRGALTGFSPVDAGQTAYEEAIGRAVRLLPCKPDQIVLVERDERSHSRRGQGLRGGLREARGARFTEAERAALALSEAVTRLSDRSDPVPDEVWNEAARHYDERALAALVVSIAATNVWDRLNVTTRQVAGARWDG